RGSPRAGGPVPGLLRGNEFGWTPGGELAVPGADWIGEDAGRGRRGCDPVWRSTRGNQGGLRGVPALARDCQADRIASRIPGTPGNTSADHAGSAGAISHRKAEAELPAV